MEIKTYAIINKSGGLENLVLWDGDTSKWAPPEGTRAVLASQVDFSSLPANPDADSA